MNILFLTCFFLVVSSSGSSPSNLDRWCRTVPHPYLCGHYLFGGAAPPVLKDRSEFYSLSVEAALNQTLSAESRLRGLGSLCQTRSDQTAWLDCRWLFRNTVLQLNHALSHGANFSSSFDSQTRLSAALTNLFTCRSGFSDINANSSIIRPIMRYNVSGLISNCLAVNSASLDHAAVVVAWAGGQRLAAQRDDFVVAKDGSANFRSIKEAVDAAAVLRRSSQRRIVIHVKAGVYAENLQIGSDLSDLTVRGDGKGKTVITAGRSVALGFTTFSSPTLSVFGDGFAATGITIRNTYGPGSQAVALLSGSDRSVFYRCSIEGYQDSLCVYTQRQFYRECDIYGSIDFIFGNAAAVIQSCNIFARTPLQGESNVITAQGRTDRNQNTGIVIQLSKIRAAPEFWPVHRNVKSYLGWPWQLYSRTIYSENFIDSIIDPAGWVEFNGNLGLDTLYYAEFNNSGPGAKVLRLRVKWKGFHILVRPSQAEMFTVGSFITGGTWLPATGVPFASGL